MARINIDDRWWVDPRRRLLIKAVGDEYVADGLALHFWKLGQEAEKRDNRINKKQFKLMPHSDAFLSCELAVEIDGGIYIKGSEKEYSYLKKAKVNGSKGGKKSAAARSNKSDDLAQANSSESKPFQPSSSRSSSLSLSGSQSESKSESQSSSSDAPETETPVEPKKKGASKRSGGSLTWVFESPEQFVSKMPDDLFARWHRSFSEEFIAKEITIAEMWLINNPHKNRKTQRGWQNFMTNWLTRNWDSKMNKEKNNPPNRGPKGFNP